MIQNGAFKISGTIIAIALSAVIILFAPQTIKAAGISKPPNNLGLLAYWNFNEGSGSRVGDSSGNNYYGTTSANGTAWVTGKRGKAMQFTEPQSGRVGISAPTTVADNLSSMTVSAWVKITGKCAVDTFISKYDTANATGWWFGHCNGAALGEIGFFTEETIGVWNSRSTVNNTYNDNKWHHAVATLSGGGAGTITIYVDGVAVPMNTSINNTVNTYSNTKQIRIAGTTDSGQHFDGTLDEVRIYNRALSASEIKALYESGAVKFGSSVELQKGSTLASSLVGHWTFDGPNFISNVADSSGASNHARLISGLATSTVKKAGKLGQGGYLPGTTNTPIVGPDIAATDGASQMTLAYWIKADNISSDYTVFSKTAGGSNWVSFFSGACGSGSNDDLTFKPDTGEGCTNGAFHKAGEWEHWVVVFDGTQIGDANRLKMYFNGEVKSLTFNSSISATTGSNTSGVTFGDDADGNGTNFPGVMDDVRIYNRALSASEAKQLYNLGQVRISQ